MARESGGIGQAGETNRNPADLRFTLPYKPIFEFFQWRLFLLIEDYRYLGARYSSFFLS